VLSLHLGVGDGVGNEEELLVFEVGFFHLCLLIILGMIVNV
jgi:hypothetical protein